MRRLAHSLSPAPPHAVDLGPGERRSTRPRNGQLSRDRLCCSSGSFANKRFRPPPRSISASTCQSRSLRCRPSSMPRLPPCVLSKIGASRMQSPLSMPDGFPSRGRTTCPLNLHDHRRALGALEILEQGDGALPLLGTSDCLFALASAVKLPFRLISVDLHRGSRRRTSLRETTASALVATSDATSPSST